MSGTLGSVAQYSPLQKSFHWITAILIVGLYGITYAEGLFERGTPQRAAVWWLHISFGLLLIGITLARIGLRFVVPAPPLPASTPAHERWLAYGTHILLYALIAVILALGLVLAWRRGDPASFFGLFTIPSPIPVDRQAARVIQFFHEWAANLILLVAGLHAVAALFHHYVRHDDILRRMLLARAKG